MKILGKLFLILIWSVSGYAQSLSDFKRDLNATLNNKISEAKADSLMERHWGLLSWFYNIDPDVKAFPLKEMISDPIYHNNIDKLFADTGLRINTLACLLASSTHDISKVVDVKKVLERSKYKNIFAAKSLLLLGEKDVTLIAKCIVAHQLNESVQYLTIDFLNVEPGLLEKFALDSLFSRQKEMQYLAVRALGVITPKPSNEELLRQAVNKYELEMKGWPIAALAHYKAKNMLSIVMPYLSNGTLKRISWKALMASTSVNDVVYVNQIIATGMDDPDFLNALLESENEIYLKSWLSIAREGKLPSNYFFSINDNEAIKNDKYFNDFCEIITNSMNEKHAYYLMQYFEGRKDTASIDFLKKCLTHPLTSISENAKQLLNN